MILLVAKIRAIASATSPECPSHLMMTRNIKTIGLAMQSSRCAHETLERQVKYKECHMCRLMFSYARFLQTVNLE